MTDEKPSGFEEAFNSFLERACRCHALSGWTCASHLDAGKVRAAHAREVEAAQNEEAAEVMRLQTELAEARAEATRMEELARNEERAIKETNG